MHTLVVNPGVDPGGMFHREYGVKPGSTGWVLIRPDGHIGARGDDPHEAPAAIAAMLGERRAAGA